MNIFKFIHQSISFKSLFKLLFLVAFCVQLVVISYNHLTGYFINESAAHFLFRLVYGTFISLIAAFLIAYPDLLLIHKLDRSWPWNKKPFIRILIQLGVSLVISISISSFITFIANALNPYTDNLNEVLIKNALIVSVINLILMAILEAYIYFNETGKANEKAGLLEKELSQIKYEMLKQQINPHFMFNSLNVLSSLIDSDPKAAQAFIDEFSSIYRYVLETIEKKLVSLEEELNFVRSYFFLQNMRYGEHLMLNTEVPAQALQLMLPPLSLQTVLENAIKHNIISPDHPLKIDISFENNQLYIKNNLQVKMSRGKSTGLGQQNVYRRYQMISRQVPVFTVKTNHYLVQLPLLEIVEK